MTLAIFAGSLLGLMALGIPVAFSLIGCGLALMFYLGLTDPPIVVLNMWDGANSYPLLAIPFFMLAGEFMNAGGLTRRIIAMSSAWIGHIRGGLGYVTVFAAVIMASLSGSALADTASLAAVLFPMMRDAGYNRSRSVGLIASGGVIAPVIPPSMGMIIFGVSGGVSITKLFLAGIVPGVLMGLGIMVAWRWCIKSDLMEAEPKASYETRFKATRDAFWALVMPVVVIGGLKAGFFTPTEAAVIAAIYCLFVGMFIYREIPAKKIYPLVISAGETTAVVMFMAAAAAVSAWLITAANIPQDVAHILQPLIPHPRLLTFVLIALGMVIGMGLDMTPTILIMTPVLMPIVRMAGIDPIYFAVLFIMNCSIGLVTPPVGTVLNVVCNVTRVPMSDAIKGVLPFMIAEYGVLLLLVIFPQIVLVPLNWMAP
ncbi:TRAP transporter large permease [Shumkonia mesophila]|uniref:TRAP transporter large permease n=1 Tax=Shumkonia mesophila TaxID=2838854 RepID=UPI0029350F68|nr:TRAP transporter large permease subunit [Shumkonia mesophila]